MSKKYLKVDIVSPAGSVFRGEADIINLRGSAGEMGVMYGHTELLSTIPAGAVNIRKDSNNIVLYISGGIMEVTPSRVTLMVDDMERVENLNKVEAEKSKLRAKNILDNPDSSKLDISDANKRLEEADAQLKALNSSKGLYYSKK